MQVPADRHVKKNDPVFRQATRAISNLKDAPLAPMPHRVKPMLATLTDKPFDDPNWIFEVKWDGYRALAEIRDSDVKLYSRNGILLNTKYPAVVQELQKIRFTVLLDGEIVVVDKQGQADFQMLQSYQKIKKGNLLYYVFDLLHINGHNTMALPLEKRKALLKEILSDSPVIKFSSHVPQEGIAFFRTIQERRIEGVMGKHRQSPYRPGERTPLWLKIKTHLTQEAVIAGFTDPRGTRKYLGALVLGMYEGKKLIFIGHAGGGLSTGMLSDLRRRLDALIRKTSPFGVEPKTNTPVTWVKPALVCEVVFHGWTDDGLMRQPVFLKLRDDKNARDVIRERSTL